MPWLQLKTLCLAACANAKDSNSRVRPGRGNGGGVPQCNPQAAEGLSNEVHGRWSCWQKPFWSQAGLDDDDVLGAVHLLGGIVAAILPLLHLIGARGDD